MRHTSWRRSVVAGDCAAVLPPASRTPTIAAINARPTVTIRHRHNGSIIDCSDRVRDNPEIVRGERGRAGVLVPQRQVAGAIFPQNAGPAAAVEIADLHDRLPWWRRP